MFEVVRYSVEHKIAWNQFVFNSKNGTFLFDRNYMDYHADRFCDNSLMVYRKGKLFALLPANKVEDVFYSHQGLTYGGFILTSKVTALDVLDMFKCVNEALRKDGFLKVIYKTMPFIYHILPAHRA